MDERTAYNRGHTAELRSAQISPRETSYVRKTLGERCQSNGIKYK